MAHDELPKDNEVFIAGSSDHEHPLQVFALQDITPLPVATPIGKAQPLVNNTAVEGTFHNFVF
jgi:hypothetical protein